MDAWRGGQEGDGEGGEAVGGGWVGLGGTHCSNPDPLQPLDLPQHLHQHPPIQHHKPIPIKYLLHIPNFDHNPIAIPIKKPYLPLLLIPLQYLLPVATSMMCSTLIIG